MTREAGEAVDQLVGAVRDRLTRDPGALTPQRVASALRAEGRPVGDATVLAVHEALSRDVLGAGPLEPLLRLPDVTDVLVNGPGQVLIDRGSGLEPTDVVFRDDESVRRLAQRLAAKGGRRLDDAAPYVDLRLADGTRFHAVLAPLARPGTALSLRVPRTRVFSLDELVDVGTRVRLGCATAGPRGRAPDGLPDQRWHRLRQDHAALDAAVAGRPDAPAGPRGGCQRAASRTPARRGPRGPARQHRGARPGDRAGPGPAGAADASRSARRRRGSWCGGGRSPRCPQHRSRGRLRHHPRQLRARRSRPGGGTGPGRRARARGGAQPVRVRHRHRPPSRAGRGRASAAVRGRRPGPRPQRAGDDGDRGPVHRSGRASRRAPRPSASPRCSSRDCPAGGWSR